jgi:hypothetical protein
MAVVKSVVITYATFAERGDFDEWCGWYGFMTVVHLIRRIQMINQTKRLVGAINQSDYRLSQVFFVARSEPYARYC